MLLVVGLGNPGKKYAATKHNFGFWVIDEIARKKSESFRPGKGPYLHCKSGDRYILMKPTTYMNNSGIAVSELCRFFKQDPNDLVVVYDDLDLPLGSIRFRAKGSSGGHRGIISIIQHIGTDNFKRLRIGIATDTNMRPSEKYVLAPFKKKEQEIVPDILSRACTGIDYLSNHTIEETMNKFNSNPEITGKNKGENTL